jgi:hypothetical protein
MRVVFSIKGNLTVSNSLLGSIMLKQLKALDDLVSKIFSNCCTREKA